MKVNTEWNFQKTGEVKRGIFFEKTYEKEKICRK